MFLLLFFLSFSSDVCHAQMMYSRMMPNDPRYVLQRPPPVRRSAMEALERLRMPPATRYFPQVDSPVVSGPYQQPPVNPLSGYLSSGDEIYALPPQWTDEFVQQLPERAEDDGDYGNYEYENVFAPVYRPNAFTDDSYGQPEPIAEPESPDNQLYNDFMVNYFLGGGEPVDAVGQPEQFDLQRRSQLPTYNRNFNNNNRGVITLSSVFEANKNATNPPSNVAVPATLTPPAPASSQVPPQVQMTAVPSSPEKKEIKSLVIPEPVAHQPREEIWREVGQKEEPLFRPLQNSQKTTWDVLTRAKNSVEKRPIPYLKKMIQSSQQQNVVDPLTEELKNLKKEHDV